MKSELKYILVSLGITLAGAALAGSGIYSAKKEVNRFMALPQITSQEELEAALAGEKQIYCMTNMVVSGAAAEDPLGILKDDYMYIYYAKEICEAKANKSGEMEYTWNYSSSDEIQPAIGAEMKLFDTYPVTTLEYNVIMDDYVITPDQVKDEYKELVDGAYYPEGVAEEAGNLRYTTTTLPMGQEVAMYATVGDGEIIMEYNEDMECYVINDGTMDSLVSYYSAGKGMMRILLGLMAIVPLGFLLLITMVVYAITSAITKKNQGKVKKQINKMKKR